VVCIYNEGYPAALELRKTYEQTPDPDAEGEGEIRVIDESGEDYLYTANYFLPIELPRDLREAVESAAELEAQHQCQGRKPPQAFPGRTYSSEYRANAACAVRPS
jgi:hypothetical protein